MISSAIAQTADGAVLASSVLNNPSLWVAISFILFLALIAKPAWKFITSSLDKKIDEIRTKIEEATKLREEAQDILAAHKRKLSDAEKEADDIINQAREEAQILKTKLTEDLENALQRREKLAMDRIAQAETDAQEEVRALTTDIALAAARGLLADAIQNDKADALINDAIKELPEKLN
ncbi:MAG: F0F1 ATP synthase subunit B [Rhodospirillales bacterium]|nr:F0F1 ATP synthase subunit B [Rhodospirillales bacterium]